MGFLNWKDWVGGALNVFKETPASDIGEGLIRHEWQGDKYNVQQTGTTLKAYIMNNLQMGLDFLIDSNHTVVNSEDHYLITIDGLKTTTSNPDGYELVENLHFSIKIIEENTNGISKLIINGDNYDFQKKENGVIVELNNLDLKAGKIYGVYYDGARFLIKDSLLPSTETEAGIISGLDIRSTEAAYVLGAEYGGTFGTALTSIEKGKVYYYYDSVKKAYTPYQALKTSTNSGGFITPDVNLFANISNNNLAYTIFDDTTNYKIYFDRQTNILKIIKKNTAKMTLESLVIQIVNFIANSDYMILPGAILSNFNTGLVSSDTNVYTGYGIFRNLTIGITFFYGANNTQIADNSKYYFHSGEISIQMEAK